MAWVPNVPEVLESPDELEETADEEAWAEEPWSRP
jgi:hypothetical protein